MTVDDSSPAQQPNVRLRVRLHPDDGLPSHENIWATPVAAHEGGGRYRLLNNAFCVPLGLDDVVEAELDGDGMLQVVGVVEPSDRLLTIIEFAASMGPQEVAVCVNRWAEVGDCWSEGHGPLVVSSWDESVTVDGLSEILAASLEAGARFEVLELHDWVKRGHREQAGIEFALDKAQHLVPPSTDYWAADDPYWVEHGMSDSGFLAYVQRLAGEDRRVARALERGRHDQVIAYISRITSADPADLPPREEPLFDADES